MKKYEDVVNSYNINLFKEGKCYRSYEFMGAHRIEKEGIRGISFTVWAPNAKEIYLSGEFKDWDKKSHPMKNIDESGVWNIFIPSMKFGELYKYNVIDKNGESKLKSDPYAFF